MGKALKLEVYQFINERDDVDPVVIIESVINYFSITKVQAINVYKEWKKEYMKPTFLIPRKKDRWRHIKC